LPGTAAFRAHPDRSDRDALQILDLRMSSSENRCPLFLDMR
jgi:hypothetical protein